MGPRKHVLDTGAHWHNLTSTTEPSMCGGDAAFLSNYFDHLFINPADQQNNSHMISAATTAS